MTTSAATLRLVRPALADVPLRGPGAPVALDASQAAVVDRVAAGADPAVLVLGAPGSGRTTVVLESVVAAIEAGLAPEDVLVLAASRRAAADLRDRVSARLRRTSGRALVQTAPAAAFAVLRARASALGEPAPTLVSGAEQDLLLGELLAGHAEGDGVDLGWPAHIPADAWTLRAFRDELRDLLMRAAERGLTPADLADLGVAHDRPAWVSAARLYEEYLDVNELRASTPDVGARFDPAVVVDEAARALLAWDDDVPGVPRPRWRLVVVDDHQESTAATARLLRVLADDGARLLLVGDPDVAVQTFRGASPALVARASVLGRGPGELGATTLVLDATWRHGPVLRDVVTRITERVGASGAVAHRRATLPARSTGTRASRSCRAPRRRRPSSRTPCAARTSRTASPGRTWRSSPAPACTSPRCAGRCRRPRCLSACSAATSRSVRNRPYALCSTRCAWPWAPRR
ncbi:UvrD-helicase domain-containing protein [Cellulomonas soli]